MKLKNAKFIPLITTLLSVVSCSSGAKPQVLAVGGNIELLDGIKLDYKMLSLTILLMASLKTIGILANKLGVALMVALYQKTSIIQMMVF